MTQLTGVETQLVDADWQQMGEKIVECIRRRNLQGLADHFHPQVAARLLIPAGLFTPFDVSTLISKFQQWFGAADYFDIKSFQVTRVADRLHISYRIRLREDGLWYLVEQQTYSCIEDGSITRFDLLCSGFRTDALQTDPDGGVV